MLNIKGVLMAEPIMLAHVSVPTGAHRAGFAGSTHSWYQLSKFVPMCSSLLRPGYVTTTGGPEFKITAAIFCPIFYDGHPKPIYDCIKLYAGLIKFSLCQTICQPNLNSYFDGQRGHLL